MVLGYPMLLSASGCLSTSAFSAPFSSRYLRQKRKINGNHMHHPGAIKVCKKHGVISLACFSCETQEMQAILFCVCVCVCVCVRQKGVMIPGVPSRDRGNWE